MQSELILCRMLASVEVRAMTQCQIGKCTNKSNWYHINISRSIHIYYCQECYDKIIFKGVVK